MPKTRNRKRRIEYDVDSRTGCWNWKLGLSHRGNQTKLSITDVGEIRSAIGKTQDQLAKLFGVHQSEISRIINHKRYA